MFGHLSSLLSTSAYIVIGSAYHLYRYFFGSEPVKIEDLHIDDFLRILEQIPVQERLQTARQVNCQWAEAVEYQCSTQKILTLQIGSGIKWRNFQSKQIRFFNKTIAKKTVNPYHRLTVDQLTEKVISFLATTFPRLQTLSVLVGELSSEDTQNSSLAHLPVLISALAKHITELNLFFKVENAPFQALFPSLAISINSLSKLKHLALSDIDSKPKLVLPSFDLPLLRSLDTLYINIKVSSAQLFSTWQHHLNARNSLMKIHFQGRLTFQQLPSTEMAGHFQAITLNVSSNQLEQFSRQIINLQFNNLKFLFLGANHLTSLSDVLAQLTRLPQLTRLFMIYFPLRVTDEPMEGGNHNVAPAAPLPSLPNLRKLQLFLRSASFRHSDLHEIQPAVFPNLRSAQVFFYFNNLNGQISCADCGWKIEPGLENANTTTTADQLRHYRAQMQQCLSQFAAPFALKKPHFEAEVIVNRFNYFYCNLNTKNWPTTAVNAEDKQEFKVPDRCFWLSAK